VKNILRLVLLLVLLLQAACAKVEPLPNPTPPEPQPEPVIERTVYGKVLCGQTPLEGVVVSDGELTTVTNAQGEYALNSNKKYGFVFISAPSGYDVPVVNTFPQFFKRVKAGSVEEANFNLTKVDQTDYVMLFFGDMHLANRLSGSDIKQFRTFCTEINNYAKGRRIYSMTLGDMSWNTFWSRYDLSDYTTEVARSMVADLRMFPTIGNHDHRADATEDFAAEAEYRSNIGPSFYSFNIGEVHYISLDNILWTGNTSFSNALSAAQLAWLQQDLSYVSKTTPIVITMHAPLYYEGGKIAMTNYGDFFYALSGFKNVKVVTGHTHISYSTDKSSSSVPILEANSGAVCGGWWMTGSNGYENLCPDGAPSGYRIMTVSGKNYSWVYKGTGKDVNYQFRSYDRNELQLTPEKYTPNATASGKQAWAKTASAYQTKSTDNYVLLNIWGYDPSWKIQVMEGSKSLSVTRLSDQKDPLYLVCYEAYEYEHHYDDYVYYPSYSMDHIFRVKASAANTTLNITVTDRFGNSYTETMTRPKAFTY